MTIKEVTLPPAPPPKERKARKPRRGDLTTKQVDPATARDYKPTTKPNPAMATRRTRDRW